MNDIGEAPRSGWGLRRPVDASGEQPLGRDAPSSALSVVITGPTAVGKSSVALRMAENLGAEILSMDSAQVYRGMDIGTAKPDDAERKRVIHHGLDLCDPEMAFDAERFSQLVEGLLRRPQAPPLVIVGGTHLYLRAWRLGLDPMPTVPMTLRHQLAARLESEGLAPLFAELKAVDPARAMRINANDTQRVLRALELFHASGQPPSLLQSGLRRLAQAPAIPGVAMVALIPDDRAALRAQIARRFHAMLEQGFEDEVDRLIARPSLTASHASQRAVGYRQYRAWREQLEGGATSREGFVAQAVAATRQYAKRQLTWLRNDPLPQTDLTLAWPVADGRARIRAEDALLERFESLWRG
ncbi:MAG: tRNA (adenosine(37)-N6)-dimethylallyltransferase MiaA [Thioalkalivibrionaceae bacterium]